jgi:hypothetical protein
MRRVGVLMSTAADDPESRLRLVAFVQGCSRRAEPSADLAIGPASISMSPIYLLIGSLRSRSPCGTGEPQRIILDLREQNLRIEAYIDE